MTADHFRGALRGRPFMPFTIRTSSGESYPVAHPEEAWVSPAGEVVIVAVRGDRGESVAMLDLPSETEVIYDIAQPSSRPPEAP